MTKQTQPTQPIIFLDTIGRTIIGVPVNDNAEDISIENPALVHVQANSQTNQLQLQLLPLFFKEFLSNRDSSTVWTYKKANITVSQPVELSPQFVQQYYQIFQGISQPATQPSEPEVVKLFDEE